jgi:hypothetical protein
VEAAEKEKKKAHNAPTAVNLEKKTSSKRKTPKDARKNKENPIKEKGADVAKHSDKKNHRFRRRYTEMRMKMSWPRRKSS